MATLTIESAATQVPLSSLQTSALLENVTDEVRDALREILEMYSISKVKQIGSGIDMTSGELSNNMADESDCNDSMKVHENVCAADQNIKSELNSIHEELSMHRKHITKLMTKVKRCAEKVDRNMNKPILPDGQVKSKRGRKKGQATGLSKPFPVSNLLCEFIGKPVGTEMARAEVTKYLHQYIKEHNLQDQNNRQYFRPDPALQSLFKLSPNDESRMHLFSVQKHMNEHFNYAS
jgi:chromatin remodeling complex protein RSC6